jgi:hypothetical protein
MLTATAVADAPASLNQETNEEADQSFMRECEEFKDWKDRQD